MTNEHANQTSPQEEPQAGEIRGREYALTPMQQGMLYMSISSPPDAGYYVEQVICAIAYPLDQSLFAEAWQRVYRHYPVLSTAFAWQGKTQACQALHPETEIPIHRESWPAEGDAGERLREWLVRDRRRGFQLDRPPLTRVTLITLADGSHRCIWTIHHAVADGRAMALVLQGVFRVYDALCRGETVELPRAMPFRDYAESFAVTPPEGARIFWEALLGDFVEPLDIPLPTPVEKADARAAEFALVERRLDPTVKPALERLAAETGVTLGTLVQSAWALLLHRYTGQTDIVFGATKSVRHALSGGGEALGLFINTLPLRVAIDGTMTVAAFARDVRARWNALRPHEHTPLSWIQAWSAAPGGTPLFNTVLMFERDTLDGLVKSDGGDWTGRDFTLHECTPHPLTVAVYGESHMLLTVEYEAARYEGASMARMLGHLETLLCGMAAGAGQVAAGLPLLTPAEYDQMLRWWQPPAWSTPFESVVARFERVAAERPEHIAVEHEGQGMTYAQLDAQSAALASRLVSMGAGPDARLGLCLPRSPGLIVSMLAVLRAGAAYVPIDPDSPEERVRFIAKDAGIAMVLTAEATTGMWAGMGVPTVCIDTSGGHAGGALPVVAPSDTAYVIYTSGTTGQPKGVQVHHEALAAFVHGATAVYGVGPADRMLQFASPSFDAAVEEIFLALCNGMTLVLRSEAMLAAAGAFFAACEAARVTILDLPTGFWHVLVEGLEDAPLPPSVHTVIIGGEAARADAVIRWQEKAPAGVQLLNTYGPTEATVVATFARLHLESVERDVPIGRPLPGAEAYVMDPYMQPAPVGLPGELCLGGPQVALGYLGRPDLTAARFVESPYRAGERWYLTGDKVCWREDGQLLYAGRFDRQVKIRGFRIELDGLEALLREAPVVKEAVVTVHESGPGSQVVVAYVTPVPAASRESAATVAREWLAARVPESMRPSLIVPLDTLPMLPSGKVDYRALPEPMAARSRLVSPPETPTEERLAALWAQVLRLPEVGCDDDFFDLGGHSLIAVQLTARIGQVFDTVLPLQDVYQHTTVRQLARRLDGIPKGAGAPAPLPTAQRGGAVPLTFDQEILWLFEQVYPGTQSYLIPMAFRLKGPLRVAILEQALTMITARHDALRMVFRLEGERPVQLARPPGPFSLTLHKLPYSPADEREVRRWLATTACKPMNIVDGPPFRGDLLEVAADDYALCLVVHHLVADGWSVGVLVRELNLAYAALHEGKAPEFEPLPLQFGDYARWQREHGDGEGGGAVAYWRRQLAGPIGRLTWPVQANDHDSEERQGAQYPVRIPSVIVARLAGAGKIRGTSLFVRLLALFNVLLHRFTGATDIVIGATAANRARLELEPLIGFFISTLPLRTRLDGVTSLDALLAQVKGVVLEAQTHQDIPYERVREITGETDDGIPLLQVLFLMQTMDLPALELEGVTSNTLNIDMGKALTDLTLELYETGEGITGWFEYNTRVLRREQVAHLAAYYEAAIEAAAANPSISLAAFPAFDTVHVRVFDTAPEVWVVPPAPKRLSPSRQLGESSSDDGPCGEVEAQMAELWQEVLRVPRVGRHENFFRIGGNSLLAIILLQHIERRLQKRLLPMHLYDAPTIAMLSKIVQCADAAPRRALHAIQAKGSRVPLFFVGSTDLLEGIAEALGPDQPLYSLNIFGLQRGDGSAPFENLEEVAALFIEEMRAVQPSGPYAIGGYCRDTMTAFEMARQLCAAGETLAHLALVDVYWDTLHTRSPWMRHLRNMVRMGPGYLMEKWRQRMKHLREALNRRRSRRAVALSAGREGGVPHVHQNTLFINDYYDAVVAYAPKPYDGKVTIYMASEWGLTDVPGWKALAAGGAEILEFDACHFNLWQAPQAGRLGALLRDRLAEEANSGT